MYLKRMPCLSSPCWGGGVRLRLNVWGRAPRGPELAGEVQSGLGDKEWLNARQPLAGGCGQETKYFFFEFFKGTLASGTTDLSGYCAVAPGV